MSWTITSGGVPAAIAGVAPLVDYRFAVDRNEIDAVSLTDKLTVTTVDADGTFVNRAGLIQQATTNIPRFDHGPASRQSLGLLMEEQRTNLRSYSESILTANGYASLSVTLTSSSIVTPTGASSGASLSVPDSGADTGNSTSGSTNFGGGLSLTSGVVYTSSIFVKSAGSSVLRLRNNAVGGVHNYVLSGAGSAPSTTSELQGATIQSLPDGWYRCSWTYTAKATAPGSRGDYWALKTDVNDGTSGIYLWGAQLEAGTSPTSYIPTTTTATTRSADDIKIAAGLSGTADVDYTTVEKPAGCVAVSGSDIVLNTGFTAQRVMVFPGNVSALRTAIRAAM
jgi:hypothetical protein